ncbi:MAG: hypothetical protein ACJA2B_001539 [Candidatus Endobugula sp.]|jgi:hypothetical protein
MFITFEDRLGHALGIVIDTTGRIQRQDKRGFIPDTFLPILQRLDIDAEEWIENTQKFETIFYKRFNY